MHIYVVTLHGHECSRAQNCAREYTVVPGDSCDGLSAKMSVPTYKLANMNADSCVRGSTQLERPNDPRGRVTWVHADLSYIQLKCVLTLTASTVDTRKKANKGI